MQNSASVDTRQMLAARLMSLVRPIMIPPDFIRLFIGTGAPKVCNIYRKHYNRIHASNDSEIAKYHRGPPTTHDVMKANYLRNIRQGAVAC